MICWILLAALTLVTAAYLKDLNARHARRRERAGKVAVVHDVSLEDDVHAYEMQRDLRTGERALNEHAFDDLTDIQNDDFVYAL